MKLKACFFALSIFALSANGEEKHVDSVSVPASSCKLHQVNFNYSKGADNFNSSFVLDVDEKIKDSKENKVYFEKELSSATAKSPYPLYFVSGFIEVKKFNSRYISLTLSQRDVSERDKNLSSTQLIDSNNEENELIANFFGAIVEGRLNFSSSENNGASKISLTASCIDTSNGI